MIDPGTQENGEDYLAYNRRRWGSTAGRIRCSEGPQGRYARSRLEDLAEHVKRAPAPAQRRAERVRQLKKAMFEAIYENGENVSDPETIVPLGVGNGVDVEGFRRSDTPAAQQDVRPPVRRRRSRWRSRSLSFPCKAGGRAPNRLLRRC